MPFNRDHNLPPEVAQILSKLEPEPLEFNRDELFFQAGFAARADRVSHRFWPAAAAALLLLSIGLSVALVRQSGTINSLQTALAGVPGATAGLSSAASGATGFASAAADIESDPRFTSQQQRNWQRLASPTPLPPGRLTATGWEELPPEIRNAKSEMDRGDKEQPSDPSAEPESPPHRPATYLELMRLQREG